MDIDQKKNSAEEKKPKVKAPIHVEFHNHKWVVRNSGDSAILFSAPDKEKAVKFAKEMSVQHKIEMKVYDTEESAPALEEMEEMLKINVEKRDGVWVVRKDRETTNLFSSDKKEEAVKFANQLDKGKGIDLHVDVD